MSFQDLEAGRPIPVRRQQEPSQAVAAGIFQINTFTRLVGSLGTPKDIPQLREKLHKTRQRIGDLVKETSAKLKQASQVDRLEDVSPAKKINDAKLAREFRTSLNEFQKAQKLAAERETMYAPVIPKESLPFSYGAHELETRSSGSSAHQSEQQAFLLQSKREEVVFMDNGIAFNEAIIEERDQGIKEIQQQIIEMILVLMSRTLMLRRNKELTNLQKLLNSNDLIHL